jgi:hypothetical protein
MALTSFQKLLCRELSNRRQTGEASYVAGGVALNTVTDSPRISRDIDLFHDSAEALKTTWDADRRWLEAGGYTVNVERERSTYVEAVVERNADYVVVEWVQDSAFRFFPLMPHAELGLTLHPIDLATNKLLAMAGRLEVRDWVDMVTCHQKIQPLGYLVNAACGKDEGYNPDMILEEAARSSHYVRAELERLDWEREVPDIGELSRVWKMAIVEAREICALLPLQEIGKCLLNVDGTAYCGTAASLKSDLASGHVLFHTGALRGVWPQLKLS